MKQYLFIIRFLIFLFLIGFAQVTKAQLNLKVGYSIARTNPTVQNAIIKSYNQQRDWLQKSLPETRLFNGVFFGLRYKMDKVALHLNWENQFDRFEASGPSPPTGSKFSQTIFFKLSTYSFGLESFIAEQVSLEASIDLNQIRYRSEQTGTDGKFLLMKDWGLGSTFSLGYNLIGKKVMHVSLRPFVHLSWSDLDILELDNQINPDSSPNLDPIDYNEGFTNYGLKIVFYNGYW